MIRLFPQDALEIEERWPGAIEAVRRAEARTDAAETAAKITGWNGMARPPWMQDRIDTALTDAPDWFRTLIATLGYPPEESEPPAPAAPWRADP